MNIIFLDVDGVLNSSTTSVFKYGRQGITGIDREKATMFTRLVEDVGAKVVLSSTWRLEGMWRTVMQENGLPKQIFLDRTPTLLGGKRGEEIEAWIRGNIYVREDRIRYVILDDDSDMLSHQMPFLVQTSFHQGLTEEDCQKVRARFSL